MDLKQIAYLGFTVISLAAIGCGILINSFLLVSFGSGMAASLVITALSDESEE